MKRKLLFTISIFLIILPFFINIYSLLRMVSLLCGIILFSYLLTNIKKINVLIFIYTLLIFISTYSIDYMIACIHNYIPIYSIEKKSNKHVSTYNSFLYRVYNCNNLNIFDNNYKKQFACSTTLLNDTDINKVLTEPKEYYKHHKKEFVKITGKVNKINGNSSIILKSYTIDDNNTLNGYVVFNDTSSVEISISNIDISNYKIYDYITVIGEIYKYENNIIYMKDVVIEEKQIYSDYKLSVLEPKECDTLAIYTEDYYTYCLSNIYVDYKVDKYELSYALKDKKITFDNLKKNYLKLEEKEDMDLYKLESFNILVCDDKKTIFVKKDTKDIYDLCDIKIKDKNE